MNVSIFSTMDYEKKQYWTLGENKPNSNPNKPNRQKAKMNVSLTLIKDYRKKDDFSVRINKPNFRNGQNERKRLCHKGLQKKRLFSSQKNKPNSNPKQTQSKPILEAMFVNFLSQGMSQGIMKENPHSQRIIQSSISTPPSVVVRESSHGVDKIALKIYPFGIDYPIVFRKRLFANYGIRL